MAGEATLRSRDSTPPVPPVELPEAHSGVCAGRSWGGLWAVGWTALGVGELLSGSAGAELMAHGTEQFLLRAAPCPF